VCFCDCEYAGTDISIKDKKSNENWQKRAREWNEVKKSKMSSEKSMEVFGNA
jgi:glycine betaine/choline ABC-type transport system substrate-binding protein